MLAFLPRVASLTIGRKAPDLDNPVSEYEGPTHDPTNPSKIRARGQPTKVLFVVCVLGPHVPNTAHAIACRSQLSTDLSTSARNRQNLSIADHAVTNKVFLEYFDAPARDTLFKIPGYGPDPQYSIIERLIHYIDMADYHNVKKCLAALNYQQTEIFHLIFAKIYFSNDPHHRQYAGRESTWKRPFIAAPGATRMVGMQMVMSLIQLAERRGDKIILRLLTNYEQRRDNGMMHHIRRSFEWCERELRRVLNFYKVDSYLQTLVLSFRDPWYPYFMDEQALEMNVPGQPDPYVSSLVAAPGTAPGSTGQLVAPVLLTQKQCVGFNLLPLSRYPRGGLSPWP
jgi:hypothetical protein